MERRLRAVEPDRSGECVVGATRQWMSTGCDGCADPDGNRLRLFGPLQRPGDAVVAPERLPGRLHRHRRKPLPVAAQQPGESPASISARHGHKQPSRSGRTIPPHGPRGRCRGPARPRPHGDVGAVVDPGGVQPRQSWQRGPPPSSTGQPSWTTPTSSRCWLPGGLNSSAGTSPGQTSSARRSMAHSGQLAWFQSSGGR